MVSNIPAALRIEVINKKLANKIKNNKKIINFIRLELLNLNLKTKLEKDLFYIKYGNILNKFLNFLDKRREIKATK